MKCFLSVVVLTACTLCAQTPNIAGVWKVNPDKSQMPGPPNAPKPSMLILIEQKDDKIVETISTTTPQGDRRTQFTYNTNDKPAVNAMNGIPMRTTAAATDGALVLTSQIAAAKGPGTRTEKFTLSPDGNTLTIESTQSVGGRDMQSTIVADKQPDSAADAIRKPEETAGAHYKNVQVLKDIPTSQLIGYMQSFNYSLGVECIACHVQGKFDADDKPMKGMARKMITMAMGINKDYFGGHMEVRCYTCHQGKEHPSSHAAWQ